MNVLCSLLCIVFRVVYAHRLLCVCLCVVGLIDGYTGERLALEQQGRERAELQLHLEQELRVTSNRLHELEQERQQIQQERELVSRQQDAMRDGAGSRELRMSRDVYSTLCDVLCI